MLVGRTGDHPARDYQGPVGCQTKSGRIPNRNCLPNRGTAPKQFSTRCVKEIGNAVAGECGGKFAIRLYVYLQLHTMSSPLVAT
jgi:hypothetical protein